MDSKTTDSEKAREYLKERVYVVQTPYSYEVYDGENGHLETFDITSDVGAENFAKGYRRALLNGTEEEAARRASDVNTLVSGTFVCAFCKQEYGEDEHNGGYDKETKKPICIHCRAECELEEQT